MEDKQCEAMNNPPSKGGLLYRHNRQCQRQATYTDGANFYCTQHAKEAATVTKKATGRIRAECVRL